MRPVAVAVMLMCVCGARAAAQPPNPNWIAVADVGYATVLDDEGLLGRGAAVSLGAGVRVTPRLTIQAVFDRTPYHRDDSYLEFDGRVVLGGIEGVFQSSRPRVRPFVTVGVVFGNDRKRWTHKSQTGPAQFRVDDITEHEYTVVMTRLAVGLDIRVSERASIRTSLRWHGLLNTGRDLAAHNILTPTIGAAFRW